MPESVKTKMPISHRFCRRRFLHWTLAFGVTRFVSAHVTTATGLVLSSCARPTPRDQNDSLLAQDRRICARPNFVVILCDNVGYGDIGCLGSKLHRTPNIDRMAQQGMRFTDFYATSGVCTPSRASLLTGCYPRRVSMHVAEDGRPVLSPVAKKGLHPDEITIAELLRARGYATACIGKWHLGDQLPFLPTRQGFDYYLGIPYSDDMTPQPERSWPPLPLMENEEVIEAPVDRNLLTKRYTEKAIEFIKANKERPFFVYLSHAMPGSTTSPFSSRQFRGKSTNGPWGDSVEELDWSTGRILETLKQLGLDERTLVVWTSDNGAPRRNPPQGLNTPLAGWGYTSAEGGQRVPCIMRCPGRIPAGITCGELCTTMDLLPTFARLAGTEPPNDRAIDGHDIWPLMVGRVEAESPYEAFYYYYVGQLQAVRSGRWKLHLPLEAKWRNFRGDATASEAKLYDLKTDVGETKNLAGEHPDIVRRLLALAEKARAGLGDVDQPGTHQRPAGVVADPTPRVLLQ
jgi:arylsulfatase A